MRVGHGYDVHAFGEGEALILGGVSIPFERAFIAHSDGDVLTHALIDAILGALGLGDIGRHFPDTDSQYKNSDSLQLLQVVVQMMCSKGYSLGNADLTIIAQRPKMSPYVKSMCKNLASVLGCESEKINIKATTSEGLGFTGREEGIACHTAGGTHHAHYSNGLGFCVFNDLAFTALNLIEHGLVEKVLILDLDVHQGDGTIDICNGKMGIYTCSLHCEQNFPFQKRQGTLDVALNSHLEDTAYLDKLHSTFKYISKDFTPDIVLYDAGVDVFSGDQLGNLNLTLEGILKRDCAVLEYFKNHNIPIATVIGGGYSPCDSDIAKRHLSIFRAANDIF